MNKPTIILLCILCFGAGAQVANYYYLSCLEQTNKYINQKRVETIKQSVNQANDLLKNRRKEFATRDIKFRASEWGVSLEI